MISKLRVWAAALGLAACLSVAVTPIGCGSLPKTVYKTVSVTHVTAEQAMSAWADYAVRFHPSADQEAKVKAAYGNYQLAMAAVADAGAAYARAQAGGSPSEGVIKALEVASATAAGALSDLIALVESLTGKKLM